MPYHKINDKQKLYLFSVVLAVCIVINCSQQIITYDHQISGGQYIDDNGHQFNQMVNDDNRINKNEYNNDDDDQVKINPYYVDPPTSVPKPKDRKACILGTADMYMNSWLEKNGSLKLANMNDDCVLDLSSTYQSVYSIKWQIEREKNECDQNSKGNLTILSLAYSSIGVVPDAGLALLTDSLQFLSLQGNDFSSMNWARFPALPILRELDLSNCRIKHIYENSFENLTNLHKIFLPHNELAQIYSNTFANFHNLVHLDLSFNSVEIRVRDPYTSVNDGIVFHDGTFDTLKSLLFLDISFTKISPTSTKTLSTLPVNVQLLSLCYSSLPIIPGGMFSSTQLRVLDLSGNPTLAYNFQADSLDGLAETLQILSVENSNIKSLHWFCKLKNLVILQLQQNNINQLSEMTFEGLDALEMLDLSSNHLSNWYTRAFKFNPKLRLLKLRDNNINLITSEMLKDFTDLHYLALGNNNFICACMLRDFMDMAARNTRHKNCTVIDRSPPNITETIQDQLLNQYPRQQRNLWNPYNIGGHIFMEYRELTELSHDNMIKLKQKYLRYTLEVYRPNGNIKTQKNRQIRNAHFEGFPLNFTFQLMDFNEENYRCINSTTNFKFFLTEIDNCTIDHSFDLVQFRKTTNTLALILGLLLGFSILYIFLYYKWWYIRYFFVLLRNVAILSFMNKDTKNLVKKHSIDPEDSYHYDVFVSYCDENRNWILDEFLPNVEQWRDIKVCLHERDFQVGLSILENIIFCMDRARCLLLVVSQSFLLSQWCQFEMHLAQHRLLETRRDQLILVLLEDVPKRKRSKTLQYLMRTKTYIKWPIVVSNHKTNLEDEKKLFWKRLKESLADNEWDEEYRGTKI